MNRHSQDRKEICIRGWLEMPQFWDCATTCQLETPAPRFWFATVFAWPCSKRFAMPYVDAHDIILTTNSLLHSRPVEL